MIAATCPRCETVNVTFDILAAAAHPDNGFKYYAFCWCRKCHKPTVFDMSSNNTGNIPTRADFAGHLITEIFKVTPSMLVFSNAVKCPDHVPDEISAIFKEAETCLAVSCYDAAGAMFRKVLDASTRLRIGVEPQSVPKGDPNYISFKEAKDLRLRLDWLFERNKLPAELKELVSCVHQDGNDAAHSAETIGQEAALDLQDFTVSILETLYTTPGRIAANIERRDTRRGGGVSSN
jgi:hypothetical protein